MHYQVSRWNQHWITLNTPSHLASRVPAERAMPLSSALTSEIFHIAQKMKNQKTRCYWCEEMIMTWPIHHVPSVLREGWVMEGVTFSHNSKALSRWHEKQSIWGAVGSPMRLHAHSNTKMHSKVCKMIQKSIWKHFGWAFLFLLSKRKVPQIGSFFS